MEYTKGIWNISIINDIIRITDLHDCLATVETNYDGKNNEAKKTEALANARLIAAAPDMYEALKMVITDGCYMSPFVGEAVHKAISKVEGKI